jgi:hypothetical protein
MRVALVGPPFSGKSTLFAAVAEAGGTQVHLDRPDQPHLVVVKVPDGRLFWLEEKYKAKKRTHAEIELLDLPGFDLTSPQSRDRARTHWPSVRQSDMIVLVLRQFESSAVPAYRDRLDIQADLDELWAEMMFADLEQITTRIDKLEGNLKKPVPGKEREELTRELELQQRLSQTLEAEKPLTEAIKSPAEEKLVRAFAFLTLKPLVVVVNCGEGEVPAQPPPKVGPYEAIFLSAKIEEELARLEASERAEFMAELGIAAPAQDRLVRLCYHSMRLVSFLTAGEKEVRAWTIPAGTNAQLAAGAIHTDLQRGFIRAEIVAYEDLVAAGDEKSAKAAGKYRLEGKDYIVKDGDVVLFRFSV